MTARKLLRLASWIAAMSLAAQFAHVVRAQHTTTLQRSDAIYNFKTTADGGCGEVRRSIAALCPD